MERRRPEGAASAAMTDLPVEAVVDDLRRALRDEGTAVLVAPPGAGKTTVVPIRLLGEPWLAGLRIVMLEPRRLAARAAAHRLADLLGEAVGETVGFTTRDERVGRRSRIEVVTEGILVRRLQHDPEMADVGLVIFDEVHERNLVTDLSLALSLDVRSSLRPDLRLLAMSATVDDERFADVLGGTGHPSPVVASQGRTFDVTVTWDDAPAGRHGDPVEQRIARAVAELMAQHPDGDVLVFCPGAAEIDRAVRAIGASPAVRAGAGAEVVVLPLHGSLPTSAQDAALAPSPRGRRRVVVATDIAESSLTVAGVRLVVDVGLARLPRFDPRTGRTRLVTEPASRASADQRAGRAGRVAPGAVHRLWSRSSEHLRPRFAAPEITTVDLTGLVLEVAIWGASPEDLAFIDPPPAAARDEAVALLRSLGAMDADGRPTDLGHRMAGLPLHPRLARIVVEAERRGITWTGAVVAAVLDERDFVRGLRSERPVDIAERARVVDGGPSDVSVDRDRVRLVRRRAEEIARRAGGRRGELDRDAIGRLVAVGHPDRLAMARPGGGFRLRDGTGGSLRRTDPLSGEENLSVAEIDADGTILAAAGLDLDDLLDVIGPDRSDTRELIWDPDLDDLRERRVETSGALILRSHVGRPEPGSETVGALLERVRQVGTGIVGGSGPVDVLRARVELLARLRPDMGWPDLSEPALIASLDERVGPHLAGARGRADLERLDLAAILVGGLGWELRRDLDRMAPEQVALPNGRGLRVRYGDERGPMARVRVQDLYGVAQHPTVGEGAVPVVLELLSPADRPVQITSDLPGFWTGSWPEVRKEMAGRYPKHPWPEDPASSRPPPRRGRRRT